MDCRSFLKLGALLPIAKSVIDKLIADRELALDDVVDWHDPVIIGGPLPLSEPIFAPDPDRIGEFDVVGEFPHKIQLTTTDNEHWFSSDGGITWINGTSEYEADAWREYWEKEARSAYLYEFPGLDKIVTTGHNDT